ncbi:MAG: ABC transporter substrate-binding protein [Desulfovibrionales bacterium]|nr:ABC transporter substrate-binding protein [Desulfovibrionales bacterium]
MKHTLSAAQGFRHTLGLLMVVMVVLAAGSSMAAEKIPVLNMGYIFTTHHSPFMVAMAKNEEFKDFGVYLRPVADKVRYELMDGDKPLALLNVIVNKSGAEATTMFAQGDMDLALASGTAIMAGIDQGTPMKMLCPTHVDGMGLVFPPQSTLTGWAQVEEFIKASEQPVKIGYHSPTSAPRIIIEGALQQAGFNVTQDANQQDADVVLVDLKETSNFIPALTSGQVDAWVGPAPHPEVSELKNVGHIALDLRDLPPAGAWHNFPCCVMAARDSIIAEHPEIISKTIELLAKSGQWCNEHKAEEGKIINAWTGAPAEAVEKSTIIYTTEATENWMRGQDTYLEILNSMNKFRGELKGRSLAEVQDKLFDLRFLTKN